ncbi:hypothetical protein SAMN05892877_105342 [Rhizobium subbaraonis]|uniref:Uncharacterized protein n=1 Tax=Rhizobium subbaraonis TaxID=908946 RepID=A0A285UEE0_9HYPH|nr:hypothetical protein SAMN05892877_105342 [Rhizobium subbaraonis]
MRDGIGSWWTVAPGTLRFSMAQYRAKLQFVPLEASFQNLVWRAVQAGWDEEEASTAIAMLADHHILAMEYNRRTDASVKRARRRK